jgi:adenylate kinase
LGPPGSGRGT